MGTCEQRARSRARARTPAAPPRRGPSPQAAARRPLARKICRSSARDNSCTMAAHRSSTSARSRRHRGTLDTRPNRRPISPRPEGERLAASRSRRSMCATPIPPWDARPACTSRARHHRVGRAGWRSWRVCTTSAGGAKDRPCPACAATEACRRETGAASPPFHSRTTPGDYTESPTPKGTRGAASRVEPQAPSRSAEPRTSPSTMRCPRNGR
mmetsp:Transcript_41622/g.120158  ORF Transcript_41622/g.120158 Transcript_41622/m.120158 type:complete len:213 (+) Transcript_41622:298-936(+)